MKRRKIRGIVLSILYVSVISMSLLAFSYANYALTKKDINNLSTPVEEDKVKQVLKEVESKVVKPYLSETVQKEVSFYDRNADKKTQETSLISYQNTYMPSTGDLYTSENEFNIVAVSDGKVKSIIQDEILGTGIEIEHANNIVSYYYTVKDILVKEGDIVKTGDILGTSNTNGISDKNSLLFEVYQNNNAINPEDFYNSNLNEAN